MTNISIKNKYVFLGDDESINIEIISKSFYELKNKVNYVLIGNKKSLQLQLKKISSNLEINEILDPLNFTALDINKLNIFDIFDINLSKGKNLIQQIKLSNKLCNLTGYDLITMPIQKSIIKDEIKFNGLTEYLGLLNDKKVLMLMVGEKFSIIPITTHIPLKKVVLNLDKKLTDFFKSFSIINKKFNFLKKFKNYVFLCINPHCSEFNTLGNEDLIFKKFIKQFIFKNKFLLASDSAFKSINKKSLFISLYHDQALIPFKLINKFSYNQTIGLNYLRKSPAHGVAKDIIFKNKSDISSYVKCMLS